MSRVDVVRAAMVEAMKAKDKARKDSLSMLLSALKNAEIDKRSPLTEEEADAVVKKEIKQVKETIDTAPADSGTGSGRSCGYPRGGTGTSGSLSGICTGGSDRRADRRGDQKCSGRAWH